MHLPEKELNGAIYQCPCGTYYRYYERGLLYFYRYDMVEGNSHWARCNEIGHLYLWTNVAPWWKTMWGITDYRHIITEEGGQTDD